jgi:hypothetical protein
MLVGGPYFGIRLSMIVVETDYLVKKFAALHILK